MGNYWHVTSIFFFTFTWKILFWLDIGVDFWCTCKSSWTISPFLNKCSMKFFEYVLLTDCGILGGACIQILWRGTKRNVWIWRTSIWVLYNGWYANSLLLSELPPLSSLSSSTQTWRYSNMCYVYRTFINMYTHTHAYKLHSHKYLWVNICMCVVSHYGWYDHFNWCIVFQYIICYSFYVNLMYICYKSQCCIVDITFSRFLGPYISIMVRDLLNPIICPL